MNREMARYSVQLEKASEARDLVRTLEMVLLVHWITHRRRDPDHFAWLAVHWIKAGALSGPEVL